MFPPLLPGYVKLPPEKFAPKKQGDGGKDLPTEAKKLQLNSAEELYAEIRDKNFNAVGSVLSKKAKVISAAFEVSGCGCPPPDCPFQTSPPEERILVTFPLLGGAGSVYSLQVFAINTCFPSFFIISCPT